MKRFPFIPVIIAAALIAAVILVLERVPLSDRKDPTPERFQSPVPVKTDQPPSTGVPAKADQPHLRGLPAKQGGAKKVAIIIDDIGYDRWMIQALAELPAPIACAVLPFTPHAAEAARDLHATGKEILLHLPMEPHSYPADDPGKGALYTDMDAEAIRRHLGAALAGVPHASGINNHMGSRFMEGEIAVDVVMEELARRGLFFVDSLTTTASRGREAAAKAGVRFAARSAFIDHPPHDGAVFDRLTHLPRRGRNGSAPLLLIGHPRSETIQALRAALPLWQEQGIEVISVAAFLAETTGGKPVQREGNPSR